jgi:hypothetical protein
MGSAVMALEDVTRQDGAVQSHRPQDLAAAELRDSLQQVRSSLDAAAGALPGDSDAALDDILAARLIVSTLMLQLDGAD